MPDKLFLPTLPHWQFGNFWSGSQGKLRFYITVSDGEDGKTMLAELWDNDVCRELAEIVERKVFPCTQEGLDEMTAYLEQQAEAFNRQPLTAGAAPHGPGPR